MYVYTVYTFTKLHDRRIPYVGVGVGVRVSPVEFKLYSLLLLTSESDMFIRMYATLIAAI